MSKDEQVVGENKVVSIHYTLTDGSGKELDSSSGQGPLSFLHGAGNVVKGLEDSLDGKKAGDSYQVTVSPAEGYGEKKGPGPQPVPRREFRKEIHLREGMSFQAEGSDGEKVQLWITKVAGSRVYVDTNHPLAGESLNFDVEVVEVREASEEEVSHGHAHGPGGHHH